MSQEITELGAPARLDTRGLSGFLSETVAIAFATGLIYVMAGAYQLGYQDQFGFTYMSLGIEDIIEIMRRFLVPLLIGLSATMFFSYIFMLLTKTKQNSRLTSVMFLLAPVCVCGVFYWRFGYDHLYLIDKEMYWLILAYYLLDVSIWKALYRLSHSTVFRVPPDLHFRIIQVATFSLFLVVLSYNIGIIYALTLEQMEKFPDVDGKQSVLVQRTNDITICAEVDFSKKIVYSNFVYFKLPSNGMPKSFRLVSFHPTQVGALIDAGPLNNANDPKAGR